MGRSKHIQGLRALSVILVLLFHADWLPGGYIGVDVFYVISGFLITKVIVADSGFSFREFYARRAKRLLPAAYLVLLVTSILFALSAPALSRIQYAKDLFSSTWYLSNYNFAYWQNDYQNLGVAPSPLIHYWSLAVEEQFYLFWPILLLIFKKRRKEMVLFISVCSFFLSVLAIRISPIWAFYSLPTRAFELGIGGLVALYRWRTNRAVLGLVLLALAMLAFDKSSEFPGFPALIPTIAATFIITGEKRNWLLDNAWAQKIGDWSYSIYLWHWPALITPTFFLSRPLTFIEKVLAIGATIFLAALTYKYYENPLHLKSMESVKVFRYVLTAGLALSFMALALYQSGAKVSERINLNEIRKQPVIYQDGCQLDKRQFTPNPRCIYGETKSSKSIVLLGDSHAAQWFPALEKWSKNNGYKLIVMTKSSCPASALPLKNDGAFKVSICNKFRSNAISKIKTLKPELVIFGSAENHKEISEPFYSKLPKLTAKTLVLRDTPWPNRDIPSCLAQNKRSSDCDFAAPSALKRVKYAGFDTFDPLPLLCKANSCPAVINGVVAYRDHSHISVQMALSLYPALEQKLDAIMAR